MSYYFPPAGGGGVQRWTKLIKFVSRLQWRFTVISARTGSMSTEDNSLLNDLPDTTNVIQIASAEPSLGIQKQKKETSYWKRWLSAFYHITDSRSKWNEWAVPAILQELDQNRYDAVIVTIPPYSLAEMAARLTERRKEPIILDMRDPWSINPYKIYPTRIHRLIDEHREVQAIDKIHYIISAYHSVIQDYSARIPGFEQKKSIVIPNGYDSEDIAATIDKNTPDMQEFKIAFSGTFYSHVNHPRFLFQAMEILNREGKNIHFYHIGKSAYNVMAVARRFRQTRFFHQMGYVSHADCLYHLRNMDAFVLLLDDRLKHSDKTIGGKVYEYLALQKPILALVPERGEAANFINLTDAGIICPYSDLARITKALRDLIVRKANFRFNQIELYSRKYQAERLAQYLNSIL